MSEDLFGDVAGQTGPAGGGPYGGSAARGSLAGSDRHGLPLAVRMRPRTLEEFIGQQHLLALGSPLRRLVAGEPMSVFLWVPSGVGKTTVAAVVSRQTDSRLE
jgi:putative ATPase